MRRRWATAAVAALMASAACSADEPRVHAPNASTTTTTNTSTHAATSASTNQPATKGAAASAPTTSATNDAPPPVKIVELPGVDTTKMIPSEKAYFSEIVADAPSPCGDPSTIETCIEQGKSCAWCVPAANDVARFVLQGEIKTDIRKWLGFRFAADALVDLPVDKSPVLGRKDARIELVEFADFECPHCGAVAPKLHALVEKNPTYANKLRLVFKNMPLSAHPHAEPAARAAWAAHLQGKFWPMHDQLFAHQEALEDADLEKYAKAAGCDLGKWKSAFVADATKARVAEDYALGVKVGVEGTPSIYVNRRKFVPFGSDEFDVQLQRWLDEELMKQP